MRNVAAPVLYGRAEMPWTGIFSLSAVTKKKMKTGSQKAVWGRGYMKIAYKAFRPDLSCQAGGSTYQYQLQKWNEIKEAKCRETGFHCAEDPLDCLSYYPVWEQAVYYMVAADGDIDEDACDSKIACTRLQVLALGKHIGCPLGCRTCNAGDVSHLGKDLAVFVDMCLIDKDAVDPKFFKTDDIIF